MHTYCHSTSVNGLWNAIKDICRECLNLVPSKESSTQYNQPWINNTVKRLSRKKQCCYNQIRIMGFTEDWLKYHQIKRESQHECHKAFNNYIANLVSTLKRCVPPRNFGATLKAENKISVALVPWLHVADKTLTNSQDMADVLNNFFASVFTHEDSSSCPYLNEDSSFPDMSPIHIHPHGVEQLLSGLRLHKHLDQIWWPPTFWNCLLTSWLLP